MIGVVLAAMTWPAAVQRLEPIIAQASRDTHLPSAWIASVITVESGGRLSGAGGGLRSPVGAMGVMQVMPQTWADMTTDRGRSSNPDRPAENIAVGSAYLLKLYRRFGFPGAFAAYHAGPSTYQKYLEGRGWLPRSTQAYLRLVVGHLGSADRAIGRLAVERPVYPLFAIQSTQPAVNLTAAIETSACQASNILFVCTSDK